MNRDTHQTDFYDFILQPTRSTERADAVIEGCGHCDPDGNKLHRPQLDCGKGPPRNAYEKYPMCSGNCNCRS